MLEPCVKCINLNFQYMNDVTVNQLAGDKYPN